MSRTRRASANAGTSSATISSVIALACIAFILRRAAETEVCLADELAQRGDVALAQIRLQLGDDPHRRSRIGEVRRSDRDDAGTGEKELEGIARRLDATLPDDRNLHRARDLVHREDGDRTNR